ncbi:MAG: peptidoglycan-associated lipoprotein Pal [Nitrospira sp.]|nr:peptidoglycan-associated lipoprotein Pal [Nitrospira sp.]
MSPQVRRHGHGFVLWLILVMIVSGCSGRTIVTSGEDQGVQASPPPAPVAEETKIVPLTKPEEPELRVEEEPIAPVPETPLPPPVDPLVELSDVYFDFDQYAIRGDARSTLNRLADLFKSESNQELIIEGHCDERGTSAYNLVLGERRAQAAKQYLEKHGMASSQIHTASYGKERPFCNEHTEACWQSNRRVHFRKP